MGIKQPQGASPFAADLRNSGLKRALALLRERVTAKRALAADKLDPFRAELFAVRQEVLVLMERFRAGGGAAR